MTDFVEPVGRTVADLSVAERTALEGEVARLTAPLARVLPFWGVRWVRRRRDRHRRDSAPLAPEALRAFRDFFRVSLYDDGGPGGAHIAYDRPGSFLAALGHPELAAIGAQLDEKIDGVTLALCGSHAAAL